jgi:hypothetical protein
MRRFAFACASEWRHKWDSLSARLMMFSTSGVCEFTTASYDPPQGNKKNIVQNLIGGGALMWVTIACSWTLYSNVAGPTSSTDFAARSATAKLVAPTANALVAAAHQEFAALTRKLPVLPPKQSFLSGNVALLDETVLDTTGPMALLGGRLTPDSAQKADRLALAKVAPPAPRPQDVLAPQAPTIKQLAQSIPTPALRPSELRARQDLNKDQNKDQPKERGTATAMASKPAALAIAAATSQDEDAPSIFSEPRHHGPSLAYASPDGGLPSDKHTLGALRGSDRTTAVYDISAHTVYMPDGTRLEAHSGLGSLMDDPNHVAARNRGATPPHVYDLTPREALFHGVPALRLTPVGGDDAIFGRAGLLAHSYMLGPRGESNGCVSFRNYDAFLQAYRNNEVKRLVVVARMS